MTSEQFDAIMALLKKIVDQTAPLEQNLPRVYYPIPEPMPYTLTVASSVMPPAPSKKLAKHPGYRRMKRKGAA